MPVALAPTHRSIALNSMVWYFKSVHHIPNQNRLATASIFSSVFNRG